MKAYDAPVSSPHAPRLNPNSKRPVSWGRSRWTMDRPASVLLEELRNTPLPTVNKTPSRSPSSLDTTHADIVTTFEVSDSGPGIGKRVWDSLFGVTDEVRSVSAQDHANFIVPKQDGQQVHSPVGPGSPRTAPIVKVFDTDASARPPEGDRGVPPQTPRRSGSSLQPRDLWVEDKFALRCHACSKSFSLLVRKHHCRACGQVFCSSCTVFVEGGRFGFSAKVRACRRCSSMPLNAAQRKIALPRAPSQDQLSTLNDDMSSTACTDDLHVQNIISNLDEPSRCPSPHPSPSPIPGQLLSNVASPMYALSASQQWFDPSMSSAIFRSMTEVVGDAGPGYLQLPLMTPKLHHGNTNDGYRGGEISMPMQRPRKQEFMLTTGEIVVKKRAAVWIPAFPPRYTEAEPAVLKSIEPDLFSRLPPFEFELSSDKAAAPPTRFVASMATQDTEEWQVAAKVVANLQNICTSHVNVVVRCLLRSRLGNLQRQRREHWAECITNLALHLASRVEVDRCADIRRHVGTCLVSGGNMGDTEIVDGPAFFGHVTNKQMPKGCSKPLILILGGEVGLRADNTDMTDYLHQGKRWLDKLYARIQVWSPSLVLVEHTIHHYLKQLMLADGVALITHVDADVLQWVAHSCGCKIVQHLSDIGIGEVATLESNERGVTLQPVGSCERYRARTFGGKSMIELSGLLRPNYVTVLLRGEDDVAALETLRDILLFATYTAYHNILQSHYCGDFWCDVTLPPQLPIEDIEDREWKDSQELYTAYPHALSVSSVVYSTPECAPDDLAAIADIGYFDPYNHTSLMVTTISTLSETHVDLEDLVTAGETELRFYQYYDDNADLSVGAYLQQRYRDATVNPQAPMHIFVHDARKLRSRVISIKESLVNPNGNYQRGDVVVWTRCRVCGAQEEPSARRSKLSRHSMHMSFGAFLELCFHANMMMHVTCDHKLHLDSDRYFSFISQNQSGMAPTVVFDVEQGKHLFSICGPRKFCPSTDHATDGYVTKEFKDFAEGMPHIVGYLRRVAALEPQYTGEIEALATTVEHFLNNNVDCATTGVEELTAFRHYTMETLRGLFPHFSDDTCNIEIPDYIRAPALVYDSSIRGFVRLDEVSSIVYLALRGVSNTSLCDAIHVAAVEIKEGEEKRASDSQTDKGMAPRTGTDESERSTHSGHAGHQRTPSVTSDSAQYPRVTLDAIPTFYSSRAEDVLVRLTDKGSQVRERIARWSNEFRESWRDKTKNVNISVEAHFPTQFAALRWLYCQGDTSDLMNSLRRSAPFQASGGRSCAEFAKTLDGKFILKHISHTELKHFINLAPQYFMHMFNVYAAETDTDEVPTVLTKILGVYTIRVKSRYSAINRADETYVLSENLLFDRPTDQVFDLKGSQRNRLQRNEAEVQLDTNLLQEAVMGRLLYCTEEDRRVLDQSITTDTNLLADANVMDYSMLVGINYADRVVYAGIIDYIREYTLDKQLEFLLKSKAPGSLQPTIIEPKMYRDRFKKWMGRYFSLTPDKLSPFRRQLASRKRHKV